MLESLSLQRTVALESQKIVVMVWVVDGVNNFVQVLVLFSYFRQRLCKRYVSPVRLLCLVVEIDTCLDCGSTDNAEHHDNNILFHNRTFIS